MILGDHPAHTLWETHGQGNQYQEKTVTDLVVVDEAVGPWRGSGYD